MIANEVNMRNGTSHLAAGTSGYGSLNGNAEAEVKFMCHGEVMVVYIRAPVRLAEFEREVRDACQLTPYDKMTVKWVDDEGDPCTIGTQAELDTAFRCYFLQQDKSLLVHVFLGEPPAPGMVSPGEDKTVYRRGARRWKKFYRVNGHRFQAKRFNKRAQCQFCGDNIWGLGRQGYRCVDCRLAVHKRCHRAVKAACSDQIYTNVQPTHPSLTHRPPQQGIQNSAFVELDPHSLDVEVSGVNNNAMELKPLPAESVREVNKTMEENFDKCMRQFNVLHCIGRGSYAKVLLVELRNTQVLYAMKVIKKEMFIPDAEGDRDEDIDWVQTEKSVYETATNHPFLVGLHSCFQSRSRLFFVIEFVPGGDLMFHMQQKRKLTEDQARFFAAEVVLALHYLHAHSIIYRDLKLDNVLIDGDGHIKLTDYGMCKENMGPDDRTSTFCGTPNYIAPEILRGDAYGYSVDWWALGVLMFEMMAGRSPFDAISGDPEKNSEDYLFQMILDRPIRIPRSLSVKATSILKGFLNKEPKERLGCGRDIYQALEEIKATHYFRSIDFDALEERAVEPPYRPEIQGDRDLKYFDTSFTDEPTDLTPVDESVLARIDQTEFEGFEYTNPLLMSAEDSV